MTLDDYRKFPKRELFEQMSVADQLAFVETAPDWMLIIGGYPTAERVLMRAQLALDLVSNENTPLH